MKRSGWAIFVLWAAVIIPWAGFRGFWNPDEGRYGEIAREVGSVSSPLVLTLAGQPYSEKPPLFFWAVAAAQRIGGVNAPASRVPSALATLLTALLLASVVRRNFGEREGLWAAMLFLVSELVFWMGGWVGIDALASLFVMAAIWAQDRALVAGRRAGRWHAVMYLAVAGVILTKGAPVVIAIAALAGRAVLERGARGLVPRHLLWGVPLVLATAAAWAVPAGLVGGWDPIWHLTGGQAGRRLIHSDSHANPFWYYLVRFPAHFLPAAVLLPVAVRYAWSEWKAGGTRRSSIGLFVLWFAVPFLIFSLISGKRERYLLPVFPAAAALCGIAAVRLGNGPAGRRWVRLPLVVALAVLGVAGLLVAIAPFFFGPISGRLAGRVGPELLVELREAIRAGLPILALGGLSAAAAAADGIFRRRVDPPVVPLAATVAFLIVALGAGAAPAVDRAKSAAPFGEWLRVKAPADSTFGVVKLDPGAICLALGTEKVRVFDAEEGKDREAYADAVAAALADPHLVLIAESRVAERLRNGWPQVHWGEPIQERGVGRRRLVAFRPAAN